MEIFFCCQRKALINQINSFLQENGCCAYTKGRGAVKMLDEEDFSDKDLNVLIGDEQALLNKLSQPDGIKYIDSKVDFLVIQQLKAGVEKTISARISWSTSESEAAKKLGSQFKKHLTKNNNAGMEAIKPEQAYLNKTLSKYFWNKDLPTDFEGCLDWMGTVRIKPVVKT